MKHYELIYCEDQKDYDSIQSQIKSRWPASVFEDGSDYIHEYRFSVSLDCEESDFVMLALFGGWAMACFGIQMMKMGSREEQEKLLGYLKQWESENHKEVIS